MVENMNLRKLEYFVGVAEAGGFTRGAKRLNVAQSALSLHIRQMEEQFGAQLLIRDRAGVSLTAAGIRLLHHSRIILDQVRLAEEEMINRTSSPVGEVSIGIPAGAAGILVPELLASMSEQFPKVSLKIVEAMSGPIEEWMNAGRFNLAILYGAVEKAACFDVLGLEELCLVVPPSRLPFEEKLTLSDLQDYPLALPLRDNNVRRLVDDAAARYGCVLDVRFEMDSLSSIVGLVKDAKAYSILAPAAVQNELSTGKLRTILIVNPTITRCVVLAVNRRDQRSETIIAVSTFLKKIVQRLIESGEWPMSKSGL